tara:strand:- start:660 stop:2060 length:1401 start_codon:yes stop_codon:yes gene_type:complete
MKMKTIFTTLLLSAILINNGIAQQISSDAYNQTEIYEDFSLEGKFFPIINTTENQFIIDNGDYFLSRNNMDSYYTINCNNSAFSDFILKTSIRIGPGNNKNASIGITLKSQEKVDGAIIFEINTKGEYRIKQLLDNTYKILSGLSKHEGWIKSKIINGVDEHNAIEIRTENNDYDVYVNNNYLTTFFNPDYRSGSCGIIISAETKARIAYYHLITQGKNAIPTATNTNEITSNTNTEERENKEEGLKILKRKNDEKATIIIEQEKEIASLNRRITNFKNSNFKSDGLENKDEKITKLNAELKNANQEISDLKNILSKQNKIVNESTSKFPLLKVRQLDLNSELHALNKKISNLEITNTELKELFILKDFEANGVKPSELIKRTNASSSPKELKRNGTVYSVQFGVFMQVQAYSTLKVLDKVWYETTKHGTYVYLSGQFKNSQEATAHKNKVAALGYPNAFVVTLRK